MEGPYFAHAVLILHVHRKVDNKYYVYVTAWNNCFSQEKLFLYIVVIKKLS